MAISILSPDNASCGSVGARTLYHLSLDRTFAFICPDEKKRSLFLKVLSSPLTHGEDIVTRQEVLGDFLQHPTLLSELCDLLSRFGELRNTYKIEHRQIALAFGIPDARKNADQWRNLLQAGALTLKRTLLFLQAIARLLTQQPLRSLYLTRLLEETTRDTTTAEFQELLRLCSRLEHLQTATMRFALQADKLGKISRISLVEHDAIAERESTTQKRGWFRRTKKVGEDDILLSFPRGDSCLEQLPAAPLEELTTLLDALTTQLLQKYGGLCDEIAFYEVAMQYCQALQARHISPRFPSLSSASCFTCRELYDLHLLLNTQDPALVVPCDLSQSGRFAGIAVFGANGSGKTVFLRALGSAQLLAQAGLPLPAKDAEIGICTALVTQFSEGEKEFEKGNEAGRFEQEVRELAAMVEAVPDGAMVLLNETFQTTAYEEGAAGLLPILHWFSSRGIRWILVSHLKALEERFAGSEVTVLHIRSGFRIG